MIEDELQQQLEQALCTVLCDPNDDAPVHAPSVGPALDAVMRIVRTELGDDAETHGYRAWEVSARADGVPTV